MKNQSDYFFRLAETFYAWLITSGNFLQNFLLFAFRLYWGWQFFLTGQGKLMHHSNVAHFFASLGIPAPEINAWFVGGLECVGGLFLLMGFASRPTSFLLSISMIVAYLTVAEERVKLLSIFKDPTPFLSADPFFFLLTAVLVFCFGPGLISIDGIIDKVLLKRNR